MDWSKFLVDVMPSLVSVVSCICSCLIALCRTSTSSLITRLNRTQGAISRSAVADPKGYYSGQVDLSSYVVVVDDKEIPLSNFVVKRKEKH